MKTENIDRCKSIIEARIRELSGADFDMQVDEHGDEMDAAQGSFLSGMLYSQRERNMRTVELLSDALCRIRENEFGLCEECGGSISQKRLEIIPETRYCIDCAEKLEKDIGRV